MRVSGGDAEGEVSEGAMRHNDNPEFLIILIAAVILVPLGIWLTKVIVESDLPVWLKVVLLR